STASVKAAKPKTAAAATARLGVGSRKTRTKTGINRMRLTVIALGTCRTRPAHLGEAAGPWDGATMACCSESVMAGLPLHGQPPDGRGQANDLIEQRAYLPQGDLVRSV